MKTVAPFWEFVSKSEILKQTNKPPKLVGEKQLGADLAQHVSHFRQEGTIVQTHCMGSPPSLHNGLCFFAGPLLLSEAKQKETHHPFLEHLFSRLPFFGLKEHLKQPGPQTFGMEII